MRASLSGFAWPLSLLHETLSLRPMRSLCRITRFTATAEFVSFSESGREVAAFVHGESSCKQFYNIRINRHTAQYLLCDGYLLSFDILNALAMPLCRSRRPCPPFISCFSSKLPDHSKVLAPILIEPYSQLPLSISRNSIGHAVVASYYSLSRASGARSQGVV